ncbi:VacJ family lipoprotein [Candidatus Pandoraea novymonadis]|uniref:Phospholipid-binding lipoprotein MlaA n=1 Tax=Candidatus Pandoraea novymonadis TaxID=1808959 RepID=A0ABX5FCV3_9BURK|nr:VacJ family lipoprotein [Candidatus Pandoraea novymonadis]PSB91571.1 putative phospholipid-binding lipoprotein MlaA [Candidatus Pandoraea novymonadis]
MARFHCAAVCVFATLSFAGCASITNPNPADPIEGFNRAIFQFNDGLDRAVLTPVAKGYRFVMPKPVRIAITNFFSNIGDVCNVANSFLQLDIAAAAQDLMRLTINTVFGVGGLVDFATPAGLPKNTQDLGLTLGKWGIPSGPYLLLPILGPTTVRDLAGLASNVYIDPMTYVSSEWVRYGLYGQRALNTRANFLEVSDLLSAVALDRYSFVRDTYLQRRRYLIGEKFANGQMPPNYDDDALEIDVPVVLSNEEETQSPAIDVPVKVELPSR